jgi:hypothetical protein
VRDVGERPPSPVEAAVGEEVPRTGDAAVDAAMARLAELDPLGPAAGQLAVLADVHEALQRRLTAAAE